MSESDRESLISAFPALSDLDAESHVRLRQDGQHSEFAAGTVVFEAGDECLRYIFVQDGSVRVHLLDVDGREIVLYRLSRGHICILTTAALLGETPYLAYAITEVQTAITTLPIGTFNDLLGRSADFRRFVFASQGARIVDLMQVISEVTFTRLNVRLCRHLLLRANELGGLDTTHDALAIELGTAREVISRNLKGLERDGLIRLGPRKVTILDRGVDPTVVSPGAIWSRF